MTYQEAVQIIRSYSNKDRVALDLGGYDLTEVPPEIGELTKLKELCLSPNELTQLPPEIGKLKDLIELNLYGNKLTRLPPEIGELTNLKTLNVSSNRLTRLPYEIEWLESLKELFLFHCCLIKLPSQIGELKNLTKLNLYDNKLTRLPSQIRYLKNLSHLNVSHNQLKQLPPEIGELKNLTELSVFHNNLIDLPPEIGKLKNIEILNLSHNELVQLPSEIGKLKCLEKLDLSNNHLTLLPSEIGELKNLKTLDISSNYLTHLPSEIGELNGLVSLKLANNRLTSPPPEIIKLGLEAIRTYLNEHKKSKTTEHNEAKLILVGNGEVGKTCLVHRLITNKFLEDKITEGINISKWCIPSPDSENSLINLNIWDFGGQEIYHATHQFFLTERSVYLLRWNARKAKDFDNIYYWLHTIEAFGGDSPIIIVMSKMNVSDDDLNIKDLKSKFPQIKYDLKIDSKDGTGINILKERIRETAWNLPLMRASWVDSWYKVRENLEGLKEYWISYDEFCKICTLEGLDNENINTLDGYLHQLGVILHFHDNLESMVILKPEWATDAFYNILSSKSVFRREGVLLYSELHYIWNKETYPPSIYSQLMDLMNKFELAYKLPEGNRYLIPELLPKSTPEFTWDEKDNFCFYYCYDYFLPSGIITRFIVRMHEDIEKKKNDMPLCWREGVVLEFENSRALVEMKLDEKRIEIRIKGNNKREALGAICNNIDHINASIKKIKVSKQIPCNCSENCPQKYPYEGLVKAENEKLNTVFCFNSGKSVSVESLLYGYKSTEDISKDFSKFTNNIPVVFINQIQNSSESNSSSKSEQRTDIDVNFNIDLRVELPHIRIHFDNLKDEIVNVNPKLDNEMDKIQDSLDEITSNSDQEIIVKPFNKLYRFLEKLGDSNSDYNKVIKGTKKGIALAQIVAKSYNKFAHLLALPKIPDFFLGD
jgi:internalin A